MLPFILFFALPLLSHSVSLRHGSVHKSASVAASQGKRLHLRHRGSKVNDTAASDSDSDEDAAAAAAAAVADAESEDGAAQDDKIELTIDASVKTLNFKLYNLPPGPFVRVDTVTKGGWADKHGIKSGSTIEEINGKEAKTMQMDDFIKNMKARPLKLVVKAPEKDKKTEKTDKAEKSSESRTAPAPASAKESSKKDEKESKESAKKLSAPSPAPVIDLPGTSWAGSKGSGKGSVGMQPDAIHQAIKNAIGHAVNISTKASEATARKLICDLKGALGVADAGECGGSGAPVSPPVATTTTVVPPSGIIIGAAPGPAPMNFAWQPVVPELKVSTVMSLPAKAGGLVLNVASQAGFVVGAAVVIGAGTPQEETNTVASFGSLVLKAPLKFDHPPGTTVTTPSTTTPMPGAPAGSPPMPMPPSPLDALRAAMAVRSNMSAGLGPGTMLPPQILEKVAEYARGRLGALMPFAGAGPAAAAPCATAPAPAPAGIVVEKVEVSMTVKNMSFTALSQDPSLMAEFEQNAKKSIAESTGLDVKPESIEVTLKSGSVIIDGKITPPPEPAGSNHSGAADIAKSLGMGSTSLATRLVARVKAMPGIRTVSLGELSVTPPKVEVVSEIIPTTTVTTTTPPTRRLPKPPKCAAAPTEVSKGDVALALAPFKPPGARGPGVQTKDGGRAWPLKDGGWAFQYTDMALRMAEDGSTRIVWKNAPGSVPGSPSPAYAVEYDESGISYHVGKNVVHRDTSGDLTYQQPTGTMHQEGSTLVYHWCNPNVVVYQTPAGFIYYDDMGMTYRSFGKDVTHYTWSGEVLYQGAGGVTRQGNDGSVTHWTDAGAIFRHPDGSVSYTPTGESKSTPLSTGDLGLDPFPGLALTTEDVMKLSIPAAAPAPALATATTF